MIDALRARREAAAPPSMQQFYRSFLQWRAEAGMDNTTADRLAELLRQERLADVIETAQPERPTRTDPDVDVRIGLWAEVAASRGIAASGACGLFRLNKPEFRIVLIRIG